MKIQQTSSETDHLAPSAGGQVAQHEYFSILKKNKKIQVQLKSKI